MGTDIVIEPFQRAHADVVVLTPDSSSVISALISGRRHEHDPGRLLPPRGRRSELFSGIASAVRIGIGHKPRRL